MSRRLQYSLTTTYILVCHLIWQLSTENKHDSIYTNNGPLLDIESPFNTDSFDGMNLKCEELLPGQYPKLLYNHLKLV